MEHLVAALALDAAQVLVLRVGLQLHEQLPHGGVGRGDGAGGAVGFQRLARPVPAHLAQVGGGRHVSSELEEREVRTHARSAVVAHRVAHAGQGQERQLVDTLGQPVGQHVAAVVAELDDRLLVGHAAFVAVGVAQLVDTDHLIVRLHRLFVAFQRTVTGNAVAFEVGQQRDDCAGALLGLFQLGDVLDHGVRAIAEELVHEGIVPGHAPRVHRPDGLLLVGEQCKIGKHLVPPSGRGCESQTVDCSQITLWGQRRSTFKEAGLRRAVGSAAECCRKYRRKNGRAATALPKC